MEFRSWFVRSFVGVRPFFLYCTTVQFCCTYMCCTVDKKAGHGHKKGHAPQALLGALIHGHLKAANKGTRCSAPNKLHRASRGHPNLYKRSEKRERIKFFAPPPRGGLVYFFVEQFTCGICDASLSDSRTVFFSALPEGGGCFMLHGSRM
jgi:hypothetical protein